jgi:transcriptional regulator with XRE-family HTH domain
MTRNEFCEQLVNFRKDSGVKIKDICFAMNTTERTVYRIESVLHSFSIDNVFSFLKAIGYKMYIINKSNNNLYFKNREVFAPYFKKLRETTGMTQKEFAASVGLSHLVIVGIENNSKNTYIDNILVCLEKLGCEIMFKKATSIKNVKNKTVKNE